MDPAELSREIKSKADSLGFMICGIAKPEFLETEAKYLEEWLRLGLHGKMQWMENYFDKRLDPRLLVDGAKSIISVLHNYQPGPEFQQPESAPKISTYAWGEDYHLVLKRKLQVLLDWIKEKSGEVNARIFTDSAPVMDKVWAKRAGLGWQGKHTNLIHPKMGSWFFIGEIILDLDLEYDAPMGDFCGTCTRCIDACPTDALTPYQIDSNKCISYLTIELRENIPADYKDKMESWAYGCDICQQVCPWNSFAIPASGNEFKPLNHLLEFSKEKWEALDESTFKKLTKNSAMSRIKFDKWKDNLKMC